MKNKRYDADLKKVRCISKSYTEIPTYLVGPVLIRGSYAEGNFNVPLATREKPVAFAVNRGKKATNMSGGVNVRILKDEMTRAPMFECRDMEHAGAALDYIKENEILLAQIGNRTTCYGNVTSLEAVIGRTIIGDEDTVQLHLRIGMFTADAAGHNMTEKAAVAIGMHLQKEIGVQFLNLSGNYCTDKKPTYINLVRGRGKTIYAEAQLSREIVTCVLGTTPERIVADHRKKNITGSMLAGALGSQNSNHANIISAVYLATGQDIANVVEGSMGYDHASVTREGSLHFSVYLPCLIMGSIGPGQKENDAYGHLVSMDCNGAGWPSGSKARKLAEITAAAVLCGELSTMAELTKGPKFFYSHEASERSR